LIEVPPSAVKTIRDLINWQYAKIISKSSGFYGREPQYGFVMTKFKELQSGKIKWSDILREDLKMEKKCIYCGSNDELSKDHIISVNKIKPPAKCGHLFEIHNIVWSCKKCNSSKGNKDLYEWYGIKNRNKIPRVVEGKYLKLAFLCHQCRGTLNETDLDGDRKMTVLDLGKIFETPCEEVRLR
jgi:hypothetical protein